jgi:hypothetical protein
MRKIPFSSRKVSPTRYLQRFAKHPIVRRLKRWAEGCGKVMGLFGAIKK